MSLVSGRFRRRRARRGGLRRAIPVVALALGFAAGAVTVVASSDPTASEEYQALEERLVAAEDRGDDLEGEVAAAEADAVKAAEVAEDTIRGAEATLTAKVTELDQREADVAAREKAADELFNRVAETSIGEGIWTVGTDVEPGTYRTAAAITGYCYWAIYRTGTNGSDIVDNDGPEGGFPTVTLSVGQDFENSGCGTFVKQ